MALILVGYKPMSNNHDPATESVDVTALPLEAKLKLQCFTNDVRKVTDVESLQELLIQQFSSNLVQRQVFRNLLKNGPF